MLSVKTDWDQEEAVRQRLAARQERWLKILVDGQCMVSECFVADFGPEGPQGLDIAPYEDHSLKFQDISETEDFQKLNFLKKALRSRWFGMVRQKDEIELSPLFHFFRHMPFYGDRNTTSLLAHEFLHTRQFCEADLCGHNAVRWGSIFSPMLPKEKNTKQKVKIKIDHILSELKSRLRSFGVIGVEEYLSRAVEMQARMYELLTEGYASWRKMPISKPELFAALYHLGLKMPNTLLTELQETDEGRQALIDFKVPQIVKSTTAKTTGRFNRIYEYASLSELQEGTWENIYPALYGNILEFMGDVKGRLRMGLGSNPRSALEIIHRLKTNPDSLEDDKISALIEKVPADAASFFLNAVIVEFSEDHPQIDKVMSVAQSLLDRADVKEQLLKKSIGTTYLTFDSWLPLGTAIYYGHAKMVTVMIKAGLDPFQPLNVIDMTNQQIYEDNPLMAINKLQDANCDPSERGKIFKGLRALMQTYPRPHETRDYFDYKEGAQTITLHQLMQKAGIGNLDTSAPAFAQS